jgi:hypothetical protein
MMNPLRSTTVNRRLSRRRVERTQAPSTGAIDNHRRQTALRQACGDGFEQPDRSTTVVRGSRTMQPLDSLDKFLGQRCGRLKNHATPRICCRQRAAVKTKPGNRVDERALAVDEVRDPEAAIAQKDRHFTALAQTQELALNGMRASWFESEIQRCLIARLGRSTLKRAAPMSAVNEKGSLVSVTKLESWSESSAHLSAKS